MSFNTIKVNNTDTNYTHSIFDISEYNSGATYTDLSAALAAIPESKLHGGMTIRYVLTDDNKYVQYRLMADEFTTDTTQWAIADEGVYVENPEFVYVETDSEGKVLNGIKRDGSHYAYKMHSETIEKNTEDINSLKNTKVDKVEGKSLIDAEYASSQSAIENPEFIEAKTDSQGKLLAGRTPDGAAFENVGFSTPKVSIDGHTIENIEDPEGRSEVVTDSEGKILSYRDSKGVVHENVGIESDKVDVDTLNVRHLNIKGFPNKTDKESIYLERPKFAEFRFYGVLPTDMSDERIPTTLDFLYKVNGQVLLSAQCTLAIQGHGSAGYNKKGYTFEPYNANGDALEIKFGNMIATDSFHLKAFATDQTHARDIGGYKVWERLIRSLDAPYNKVNNIPFALSGYSKNISNTQDAQYHPDGFPCMVYVNDKFHGLYSLRLKKTRQNYAMEKSQKSMIFLDATNYYETIEDISYPKSNLGIPFDHRGWDLKNPKLKNYEEGGEISDATVLANIERLFNFTSDIQNQYQNYEDYIVLPHWIVYVIVEELLFSEDVNYNNINLLTWDATHWSILPYDLDLTYGLHAWTNTLYGPANMNTMTLQTETFLQFKILFQTQIKEMYTKMRSSGIISSDAIMKIYKNQIAAIPRDIYSDDYKKWGNMVWNNGYTTIEHINANVIARIEYLDSIWLLNSNNN